MSSGYRVGLVLDEHVTRAAPSLRQRGIQASTVEDFNVTSTSDPDVIRTVAAAMRDHWVLVTLDGSLIDESPRFEWDRYAIAWVLLNPNLRGIAAERAKIDIVHRHAHQIAEQQPGDHFSYTQRARHRSPPSLVSARQR